jgi:diguanylate cyclase (GGDEF)-like protein
MLLRSFAPDSSGAIYLMTTKGAVIASSDGTSEEMVRSLLPPGRMKSLLSHARSTIDYTGRNGDVIGTLEYVPQVNWAVVAEISADAAYRQIRSFRNFSLMAVAVLLILVAGSAYRFGLLIARPLDRLAEAASEVAAGDLAVDLPEAAAGGEVGYLTGVFNHMVARLRDGRRELDRIHEQLRKQNEELEQLSTTDSLTGLANHRSLMQSLEDAESRFKRDRKPFSVLVADVDHFKQYNDAFGHPAGDEVLKNIADIMKESTRPVDCVARYGGEEFVILLPDTNAFDALEVAEHIRARIAAKAFTGRKITLSIGVSEFPVDGESGEAIIGVADEALYQAKREGRDRAIRARKLAKTGS